VFARTEHASFIRTRLIYDSFIRVPRLIHDSFIRVTWLIRTCGITHLHRSNSAVDVFVISLGTRMNEWWLSLGTRSNSTVSVWGRCGMTHRCYAVATARWACLRVLSECVDIYDMTHSYLWHDSPVRRSIWTLDVFARIEHDSFMYVWYDLFRINSYQSRDPFMTHSNVWHDSFICVTRLIHMRDMPRSYVWHDSVICVTWLVHMRDMPRSYVWHDSFICVTRLIHMRGMTHSYTWHDSFIYVT